ncbi:MAG: hypothetical protein LBC53_08945 [Spirochaetaceae bacterium]|jgi:hypothetical protein|nr:hypothetical protein [Spirochaetaceae bacterium]
MILHEFNLGSTAKITVKFYCATCGEMVEKSIVVPVAREAGENKIESGKIICSVCETVRDYSIASCGYLEIGSLPEDRDIDFEDYTVEDLENLAESKKKSASSTVGIGKWGDFSPLPKEKDFFAFLKKAKRQNGESESDWEKRRRKEIKAEFQQIMINAVFNVKEKLGGGGKCRTYKVTSADGQVKNFYIIRQEDQAEFEKDIKAALPFLQRRYHEKRPLVLTKTGLYTPDEL